VKINDQKNKTHLAVEKIPPKPHTSATNSTVIAMIDGFAGAILPKLTNIAVILGRYLIAVVTYIGCFLRRSTKHAEHVLCVLADQRVILVRIVAEPTSIPLFASGTLQLHVPLIAECVGVVALGVLECRIGA
jgi:hypothetical protein